MGWLTSANRESNLNFYFILIVVCILSLLSERNPCLESTKHVRASICAQASKFTNSVHSELAIPDKKIEHITASEQDPELGQENVVIKNKPKSQPEHGWQSSDALNEQLLPVVQPNHFRVIKGTGPPFRSVDGTIHNLPRSLAETVGIDKDVWEKPKLASPAYALEYFAEWDRMLSSQCLHQEQTSAHNEIGRRIARRLLLLNGVNLLLAGVMLHYAYFIDSRPRSIVTYVIPAETEWHISLLSLTIGERYEHDKLTPGEFRFKLDFENLPALKELVGEQKWKDMQESRTISAFWMILMTSYASLVNHRQVLLLLLSAEVSECVK